MVAGQVGCFGGDSIAAGLCTHLIVTPQGRIGLNGPAVIEQEAGVAEFDSSDRALIWAIDGGEQRHALGLADTLVPDDVDALRGAVREALDRRRAPAGPAPKRTPRCDRLPAGRCSTRRTRRPRRSCAALWGRDDAPIEPHAGAAAHGRRRRLAGVAHGWPRWRAPSRRRSSPRCCAPTPATRVYLAVVPDPDNPFHRARSGEVGLTESLALAQTIRQIMAEDAAAPQRRAIVAVVDLPSQAYGRIEEMAGLHQTIAAAVDAYAAARVAGHPVVAIVVGKALSGGFLAHGLQAQQILALDDPGVEIHAMHKAAAARITLRTVAELDELGKTVLPISYDVRDWAQLGFCDGLLAVQDADAPTAEDTAVVGGAVTDGDRGRAAGAA